MPLTTVTAETPVPDWALDDGAALESAVVELVSDELTGHVARVVGEPELIDTYRAAEGLIYAWAIPVHHATSCPCGAAP